MLPLSKFHRLPPMFLELNISSITSLSVYASARDGNVTVKGDFSTEGNFVVSKEYHSPTSPPTQQATVNNWTTLQGTGNTVLANTTFYYNVNVSQEICIQPYIRWAKKDVHLKFSSPFKIRLDQGIVASSTAAVSAIQNEAMSNITGYFDTSDNRVDIRAFGVQIWDLMLSPGQHQTEAHVTNHSLFSQSMANCFGDPSELDMGSCGDPGTAIIRTSENFDSLKKIFGDELILFTDDENKTCTWCGRKGRQCRSCSEYSVDANEVCADRLMVSAMATAITKLAKFIQAEWANRRLVVLDAWTEPTSLYPEGKYGHSTLHNEGRAASVGISKPLFYFPPNVEIETDREILHRLKDLFRCSGFSSAVGNATDGVYELCVSNVDKSQKYHTKKRRKRKRQANNDMSSHSEKREDLAKKMAALPGTKLLK
ncbi:hypothetical protein FSP39_023763 [Pinctada imbricata]|uniref:Hedgehog N-terminal signalling domain-containing protein n=1 Tax=Pinctada imbricata TaxID=66713 RepID=A0AA88XXY3_PINIB|nr:hypothetical protein FSP39_023763 [Pinctada imbricata]